MIAGSPLISLTWRRVPKKVMLRFREHTETQTKIDFLKNLIESAKKELDSLTD